MFSEVHGDEIVEQKTKFEVEVTDTRQRDSGFKEILAEEVESVDFEEVEEELFAQSDDMAG